MIRFIAAVLIPCLFMQLVGCYSFKPLGNDRDLSETLKSGENQLIFVMKDGQKVKANVSDIELIKNSKFIVYGSGRSLNKVTQQSQYFYGELNGGLIDSLRHISIDSKDYLVCWLKDSTRISFDSNKYLTFTLNPDSSYWLVKNFDSPEAISINDISAIEAGKLSVASAVIIGVLAVACMIAFAILVNNLSGGSFNLATTKSPGL